MFRVLDYISSGLDSKIIDPDGGIHENRLREEKDQNTIITITFPFPSKGWTSSLCQLPPFGYGCIYAHLIGSPTIPSSQVSSAADAYQAGAMKHKEEGYRLFRDNHVMMVRFNSTDNHYCLFHAYIKPSLSTGKYCTVVSLKKSSGHVVGAKCNCKAGAGGCLRASMLLLCCIIY